MLRVTWLAMLCCLHASALASPRSDPTQGRAAFTGASSPNPTSIEINPAALGLGPELNEFYVAATGVWNRQSIQRRELDIDSGALTDGAEVSSNLLSPGGMLAFIWHSGGGGRITLGVALHSSPAERFIENEDALRYHTLGGSHRTYAGTVAGSIRASSRFYVGVSVSLRPTFLHLRFARDTALEAGRDPMRGITSDCGGAPCGVENPLASETYDVDVRSGWVALDNVVGTVGIAVRIMRNVWLGIAYHTPPGLALKNELTGTMLVDRAARDGGNRIDGVATVYLSQPATFDAELRARVIPELEVVAGARLEDLSRMQAYDVRGTGSLFPGAGVPEWQLRPRGFRDVLQVPPVSLGTWVGIDQVERELPVVFSGRIGFETSSTRSERTSPTTIAPASFTLDAGLAFRFTRDLEVRPQVMLQASYGLQYFPTVDVTSSAFDPRDRLACADSGYDYSTPACESVRNGYAIPTAAGEYSRIEQAARVALRLTW
jgi:hypothetical protein